jgi:predicted ester cyclase
MTIEPNVRAYTAFFEALTPETLAGLSRLCARNVRFRDPFNDVTGVERFQAVLARMFHDVEDPRFTVDDWAISGRAAYLRWTFTCRPPRGREPWTIVGMSEVRFDEEGRVTAHIDHWDAASQVYERIPILGRVMRAVRRRLAI